MLHTEANHEDVVAGRNLAASLEELNEVVELAMYVSTNCDGRLYGLYVGFFHQYVLHLSALGSGDGVYHFTEDAKVLLGDALAALERFQPLVDVGHFARVITILNAVYISIILKGRLYAACDIIILLF